MVTESNALWKATIAEMDRLLVQRIAGFETKLWLSLGASVLIVLLALALASAVVRSVSRPPCLPERVHGDIEPEGGPWAALSV